MATTPVPYVGLVIDPMPATPEQALTAARDWLDGQGQTPWDIWELNLPARVVRAWWGGTEVGFVQPEYPGAVEIAVVNLPERLLTPPS